MIKSHPIPAPLPSPSFSLKDWKPTAREIDRVAEVAAWAAQEQELTGKAGKREMNRALAAGMREFKRREAREPSISRKRKQARAAECKCDAEFLAALRQLLKQAIQAIVAFLLRQIGA
jgi:hypothetical protein